MKRTRQEYSCDSYLMKRTRTGVQSNCGLTLDEEDKGRSVIVDSHLMKKTRAGV